MPVQSGGLLLNCAVVIQGGNLLGVVPKTYLPNYNEFYEKRWFASAQDLNPSEIYLAGNPVTLSAEPKLFQTGDGVRFGVEICEDVWAPIPPSNNLTMAGADIIFNCSASDELIGKHRYLRSLLIQQSARTMSGYVYSSCGFGESTQDVVYGGNAMIFENGRVLAEGERYSFQPQIQYAQIDVERLRTERHSNSTFINAQRHAQAKIIEAKATIGEHPFTLTRAIDAHPFIPSDAEMAETCEEILNIQTAGLAKRLVHTNCEHVVVGISGGLDSTLALLVCVRTFDKLGLDRKGIIGVTMPGFGTTDRTHDNAASLMQTLNISQMEISISKAVNQHFKDIGHDGKVHDDLELCKRQQKQQQDQQNQQNKDNKDNKDQKDKKDQQKQDQDKKDQQKQDQQQQQQNKQQMSKENAEQMLNAAIQEEKQTQERMKKAQQQPNRRSLQKNW